MKIPDSIPWKPTGETLGSGGQGVVHLVTRRDQPNGPRFALKALRNVDSRQARERFRREIETVKHLLDPIVVHEGAKTLGSVIFSESNPFHGRALECLGLLERVALGIRACERSNPPVIHRDINPRNILLLPDGSLRLIDFGVCQIQDGEAITLVDEDVGARNYTAPECEAGNDAQVGVHSDLYSAGKVLWSSITSQRAFSREEPVFGSRSIVKMLPAEPAAWHLSHIFEKTVRADPADRVRNADQLLELIAEVRYLVERGYPPLEEVGSRCPSCGSRTLKGFPGGHAVFGNPNPRGVESIICSYCGYGFVRNLDYIRQNLDRLRDLK